MFSRFEKVMDPSVPESESKIESACANELVELRESVPEPALRDVGSDPLRVVSLIVIESSPMFRLLIPAELNVVVT